MRTPKVLIDFSRSTDSGLDQEAQAIFTVMAGLFILLTEIVMAADKRKNELSLG